MSPLAIIEDLDVFEERGSGLTLGGEPGSVHELGFKRTEEALHRGIVEAITLTAHGDLDVVEPEQLAIVATGVLGATIRVVDRSPWRSPVSDRHLQRILAKGALQTFGHRPADDLHRRQILDSGEVEPAFVRRDVRYVGQPDCIGQGDIELPLKKIGRDGMRMAAVGGDRYPSPASQWTDVQSGQQSGPQYDNR